MGRLQQYGTLWDPVNSRIRPTTSYKRNPSGQKQCAADLVSGWRNILLKGVWDPTNSVAEGTLFVEFFFRPKGLWKMGVVNNGRFPGVPWRRTTPAPSQEVPPPTPWRFCQAIYFRAFPLIVRSFHFAPRVGFITFHYTDHARECNVFPTFNFRARI